MVEGMLTLIFVFDTYDLIYYFKIIDFDFS